MSRMDGLRGSSHFLALAAPSSRDATRSFIFLFLDDDEKIEELS